MFPNSPNSRLALLCVASSLDNIGNKTNVVKSKKEVIGSLRSVTKLEYSTNVSLGLKIDLKVVIQSILYDESKFVQINDDLYKVERTYIDGQFIELYLSKSDIEVTP
jgi:hypothetical protein